MQKKKLKNIRKKNSFKTSNIKVDLIDHMGSDLSCVNAARVSFHKESDWEYTDSNGLYLKDLSDKDTKLIRYLAKHKHTSPFNHCFISIRVKAPIFVARQLVKHKFMPWNEVSRRYVDDEPEFYFPEVWRAKAENVKQGSSDASIDPWHIPEGVSSFEDESRWWCAENSMQFALDTYHRYLAIGICPEQARMVLPQNTMTEWIWSGTLGAFADMLKLRLSPYTQQETREVAEQIKALVEPLFPVALPALLNNKE
jgi:thymidylate synthase (FAD)